MVAPEIGNGSLQFLSSLPVSRQRIWRTKFLVGLIAMILGVLAATIMFVIVYAVALHAHAFTTPLRDIVHSLIRDGWPVLLFTPPLFSLGLLMTMLVDRTISAVVGTIVAAAIVATAIIGTARVLNFTYNNVDYGLWAMFALTAPTFLSMSYRTFIRGETLKTSNRFKVAIPGLLIDIAIILGALVISIIWILW
jgi:ABC-type transport system involved in multi-copper enzyme maturation permease subunit